MNVEHITDYDWREVDRISAQVAREQAFGEEKQYEPMALHRAWFAGLVTMDEVRYLQNTDLLSRLGPMEKGSQKP